MLTTTASRAMRRGAERGASTTTTTFASASASAASAASAASVATHDSVARARAWAWTWTPLGAGANAGGVAMKRRGFDAAMAMASTPWAHAARRGFKKAHRRVEVILTTPIDGLGRADDVVSVRPGRARNHLVPGRMATYVNAEKLEAANARRAAREMREMSEDEEAEASASDGGDEDGGVETSVETQQVCLEQSARARARSRTVQKRARVRGEVAMMTGTFLRTRVSE